jgi:membrane protease YdiL (CAAX protease family)
MRRSLKLLAVFLFYLFNAFLVVIFSSYGGVFTYPLIIIGSVFFIQGLDLKVPKNGFLAGALAASVSMGLIIAVLASIGAIAIGTVRDDYSYYLILGIVVQLLVGFGEELSFRASIFQGLDDELGVWPAAVLSSAGFAALHLPSIGLVGLGTQSGLIALGTIFFAGIALALLYKYGGLFNAISFHIVWNYIEYNLFNLGPLEGAIGISKPGPDILTGGAFGPEASIITLIVVALLVVLLWLYYTKLPRKANAAQNISAWPRI